MERKQEKFSGGTHVVSKFEGDQQFQHLVVDKNTGMLYIGAVNKLYHLSSNLELMVSKYFSIRNLDISNLTIITFD